MLLSFYRKFATLPELIQSAVADVIDKMGSQAVQNGIQMAGSEDLFLQQLVMRIVTRYAVRHILINSGVSTAVTGIMMDKLTDAGDAIGNAIIALDLDLINIFNVINFDITNIINGIQIDVSTVEEAFRHIVNNVDNLPDPGGLFDWIASVVSTILDNI